MILPILFCRELVPLVMSGRKTRTRRVPRPLIEHPSEVRRVRWAVGDLLWVRETWGESPDGALHYAADYAPGHTPTGVRWRPSIHLPRVRARTWLRVELVRLEPLSKLTRAEARREGFATKEAFFAMWQRLNPSLPPDPFVWVLGFELAEAPRRAVQQALPGVLL